MLGSAQIGCSHEQDYSRLPVGEEATWHSLSLSMSLWASLSLHLTVCCSPLPSIPAVWSQPARVPPAWPIFSKPLLCLPVSGPLLLPISASLKDHLPDVCLLVCLPQKAGTTCHVAGPERTTSCVALAPGSPQCVPDTLYPCATHPLAPLPGSAGTCGVQIFRDPQLPHQGCNITAFRSSGAALPIKPKVEAVLALELQGRSWESLPFPVLC